MFAYYTLLYFFAMYLLRMSVIFFEGVIFLTTNKHSIVS